MLDFFLKFPLLILRCSSFSLKIDKDLFKEKLRRNNFQNKPKNEDKNNMNSYDDSRKVLS